MPAVVYPTHPPTAPSISWTYAPTTDVGTGFPCCIVSTPSPCTCPPSANVPVPPTGTIKYVPTTTAVNLVKRYTECILESYRYEINLPTFINRELSFRIGYRRQAIPYWDPATTVAPFLPSQPGDPPADSFDAPQGLIITQDIADRWLWNDLCQIAQNLNSSFTYPLHQNQIDGLCSFIYSGGQLNGIMLTAINNIQNFSGTCQWDDPPGTTHTATFSMSQWDPDFNVVAAEIQKYVFFRGNKLQSLIDRRYEESNLITGSAIPYTIPGAAPVSASGGAAPFWGQCAVHQSGFINAFGEGSSGSPYWKGGPFPP